MGLTDQQLADESLSPPEKTEEQKLAAAQSTLRSLAKKLLPEDLKRQVLAALPPEKPRGRKKKVQK